MHRSARFKRSLVSIILLTVYSFSAQARDDETAGTGVRTAQASKAIERPIIDGIVDDDAWKSAEILTDFVQAEPLEGRPATEKTEVRILYDDNTIYVGATLFDSDPSQIIATDARRDSALDDTDSFQIILDTYLDRQNGFVFGTNPSGLEYDGQVTNEGEGGQGGPGSGRRAQAGSGGGFNINWDASWTVATHVGDYGWSAEFAIPLRSLRYGNKPQVWGVNFQRNIRRKREEDYWSPVSRIFNLHRLSSAGELHGLDLETPRNFKVTPYGLTSAERDFATREQTDYDAQFGVDAKFGVTPSLNLDLTYNTDFAQVEVDAQQVNLTRFNLFFPEKRPFFLENAGNFSMGQAQKVELFFSRRIGIGPAGEVVPIIGGGRLSGKVGSYNVGFLNMQTDSLLEVTSPTNFTVASVSREFKSRSSLGALFVNRMATGSGEFSDQWNRTYGFDGKLGIGEDMTFTGFAARTQSPNLEGREHAFSARGEYKKLLGRVWLEYSEVGGAFNPEVGFLTRRDYRNLDTGWFVNWRPDTDLFRELRPHVTYRGFWDFEGFKETENVHMDVHFDFENGYYFSPATNYVVEGLRVPFEIYPGVIIPAGTYKTLEFNWMWNTNTAAPLSYSGGVNLGGFYSGKRRGVDSTINWRVGTRFISSATWSYNNVNLPQGQFVTNLGQFRFAYNFTPLMTLQTLFQYNDLSDTWASNIRFSWLRTAGTGLFVVYNDTAGLGDLLIGPQNRSFVIKYSYQFDVLN